MELTEFKKSLTNKIPPVGISPELEALWFVGVENWETAHEMVKFNDSENGIWIHAYLHRLKNDNTKAKPLYKMAKKDFPKLNLKDEFIKIAKSLLEERGFCMVDDF